eukprot:UN04538
MLNGVCNFLLLEWNTPLYTKLCCGADLCLQMIFKTESTQEIGLEQMVEITQQNERNANSSPSPAATMMKVLSASETNKSQETGTDIS